METLPSEVENIIRDLERSDNNRKAQAAEALGELSFSHERIIIALEKLATSGGNIFDGGAQASEAAEMALRTKVHQEMRMSMGRSLTKEDKEIRLQRDRQNALDKIILVTTPILEGKHIEQYLGIVTAEVVLGTGLLSELHATIADTFGTRSSSFQNKLKQAKNLALEELRQQALSQKAHAIIGIDLDYTILGSNLMMVVACGTAVNLRNE